MKALFLILLFLSSSVFSQSANLSRKGGGSAELPLSCYVRATGSGRTISTSQVTYLFATEIDDECSSYNNSTGVFTAPEAGKWIITGDAATANVTYAVTNYFVCVVNVGGGGAVNGSKSFGDGSGSKSHISSWAAVLELEAGENVTIGCVSGVSTSVSGRLQISRIPGS